MNLTALIAEARNRLDDETADAGGNYLWSDADLTLYINDAYEQAVIRYGGVLDNATAAICTISVTASDATYSLDSRILHVLRAKLSSQTSPLIEVGLYDLDNYRSGWESDTDDTPLYYTEDTNRHELTLYPSPDANDTLSLVVRRRVATALSSGSDTPDDIPTHKHIDLLHWVCYLAYLKQDSDTEAVQKAMIYKDMFAQSFGPERSLNAQEFERDFRQKQVNFRYFA